jgi:hypothetical protein
MLSALIHSPHAPLSHELARLATICVKGPGTTAVVESRHSEAHEERDSQDRADHEADEHQCDQKAKEAK